MIIIQEWTNIQQWDQVHTFYTLPTSWLSLSSSSSMEKTSGPLVLWWIMWQPTLEVPWHQTYVWADFDSPQNNEPSNHDWYTHDCISNSMWCTRPYNDCQSLQSGMACNPHHMGRCLCLPPVLSTRPYPFGGALTSRPMLQYP